MEDDLALLRAGAKEAGRIALGYFRRDPKAWTKGVDSPVTEADIASDRYLHDLLTRARPDYGWLSEETADTADRLSRRRVFVVDPIDGTRGFIAGNPDWCVSVALVEDGRPIAGVLAVPARDELFEAAVGQGARLNGAQLWIGPAEAGEDLRFSGPRRHQLAITETGLPLGERRVTPSLAYRIALVAAGRLDLASATRNASDWDLAAADLLVHEAGGSMLDRSGAMVRYNRPDPRHPALLAGSPVLVSLALAGLVAAEAEIDAGLQRLGAG